MTPSEEYFAGGFEAVIPGYRSRRIGGRDLLAKTKTALLQALQIVDELPRSHWVWQPGYAVQTVNVHRLGNFCAFRLRENPCDELALWARIGMSLGDEDFAQESFRILKDREEFDAAWPVYAGCYAQWVWSGSQHLRLGAFLRETDLLLKAGDTIAAILERRDPYIDVFEIEELTREAAAECLAAALR